MKKSLLTIAVAGALALSFSGCVGGEAQLPQQIKTNKAEKIEISLNYNDTLSDKKIDKQLIKDSLIKQVNSQTSYKLGHWYFNRDVEVWQGLYLEDLEATNTLTLTYLKGRFYVKKLGKLDYKNQNIVTYLSLPLSLNLTDTKLSVAYPNNYEFKQGKVFIETYKGVDKNDRLLADSYKIFKGLEKLAIIREYKLESEVNSKYDSASVNANFKRLVHRFSQIALVNPLILNSLDREYFHELTKENPYMLEYKNSIYPIYFNTYPYRGGSKVTYTMYLQYKLYPDNTSSLTKEDIEAIKAKVENIVND